MISPTTCSGSWSRSSYVARRFDFAMCQSIALPRLVTLFFAGDVFVAGGLGLLARERGDAVEAGAVARGQRGVGVGDEAVEVQLAVFADAALVDQVIVVEPQRLERAHRRGDALRR